MSENCLNNFSFSEINDATCLDMVLRDNYCGSNFSALNVFSYINIDVIFDIYSKYLFSIRVLDG